MGKHRSARSICLSRSLRSQPRTLSATSRRDWNSAASLHICICLAAAKFDGTRVTFVGARLLFFAFGWGGVGVERTLSISHSK